MIALLVGVLVLLLVLYIIKLVCGAVGFGEPITTILLLVVLLIGVITLLYGGGIPLGKLG